MHTARISAPRMANQFRHMIARHASRQLHRKMARLPDGFPPTVTFTFDDFPRTAVENGLPLLRDAGMPATWYLATGLLGEDSAVGAVTDAAGVAAVHAAGHEVGCHTASHLRAEDTPTAAYDADLAANQAALGRLLPGVPVRSFSFPFGSATAGIKQAAAARYVTCRSTESGRIGGEADLAFLPANRLYSDTVPLRAVDALVSDLRRDGGWLIFYTHDVAARPSPWGCTPGYLADVVAAVGRSGAAVRTMGAVATQLGAA